MRGIDTVVHAAALKHVPLLELHPDEGQKTNVVGTKNLLDAALRTGVTRFVNISTDKADVIVTDGFTGNIFLKTTEGAAQIALIGPPNGGKSALHARLTGSHVASEPYPFATQYPQPGMYLFEDVAFQHTPKLRTVI